MTVRIEWHWTTICCIWWWTLICIWWRSLIRRIRVAGRYRRNCIFSCVRCGIRCSWASFTSRCAWFIQLYAPNSRKIIISISIIGHKIIMKHLHLLSLGLVLNAMSLIRIEMAVFRLMALNCCRWVCRFYHHLIQLTCHVIRGLVHHLVSAMAIPISETQRN